MTGPLAPSMPTERQIRDAQKIVAEIHPGPRIARLGLDGIEFAYPDQTGAGGSNWAEKPFTAGAS